MLCWSVIFPGFFVVLLCKWTVQQPLCMRSLINNSGHKCTDPFLQVHISIHITPYATKSSRRHRKFSTKHALYSLALTLCSEKLATFHIQAAQNNSKNGGSPTNFSLQNSWTSVLAMNVTVIDQRTAFHTSKSLDRTLIVLLALDLHECTIPASFN